MNGSISSFKNTYQQLQGVSISDIGVAKIDICEDM
jgi:hypothetical protein